MAKFSNNLSDAELERLAKLAEECGEVVQIVNKIIAHGYESRHPYEGTINRISLMEEIGDLRTIIALMVATRDIDEPIIETLAETKAGNLLQYMHHQE